MAPKSTKTTLKELSLSALLSMALSLGVPSISMSQQSSSGWGSSGWGNGPSKRSGGAASQKKEEPIKNATANATTNATKPEKKPKGKSGWG